MDIRNIKFKAKRLDNGKWVEGYFYGECGNAYIIENRQEESTASDYWYRRLRDFEYKICYGFVGKRDHRITKAISLTKKK